MPGRRSLAAFFGQPLFLRNPKHAKCNPNHARTARVNRAPGCVLHGPGVEVWYRSPLHSPSNDSR